MDGIISKRFKGFIIKMQKPIDGDRSKILEIFARFTVKILCNLILSFGNHLFRSIKHFPLVIPMI